MDVPVGLVPTSRRTQTSVIVRATYSPEFNIQTIRLEKWSECIEKPSMTVELLLVLLFQAEQNLNGA